MPIPFAEHSLLANAFSEFITASARLEHSYRELQEQVTLLSGELADRNAALSSSLSETRAIRFALQQILDSMPCGVLVLDARKRVTLVNPEAIRLLNLKSAKPPLIKDLAAHPCLQLAALHTDPTLDNVEQEFRLNSSSSDERWIAVRYQKLPDVSVESSRPAPDHAILILRDITDAKRAERDREMARNAVALAEVSTVLAHEIRNPLASLELFTDLLSDTVNAGLSSPDDQQRCSDWISHLRAGIRQLAGTVNNVLDLHAGEPPVMAPVNLQSAIRSGVEFIRPIADEAGILLNHISSDSETRISGNRNALQQVVLNLARNAIRHTEPGGRLTIEVTTAPNQNTDPTGAPHALVLFSDTGCGIAPQHLDQIFDPGFSASGHTSGLGLAVCRRIMEQHNGAIDVHSRLGQGTTFTLRFPLL